MTEHIPTTDPRSAPCTHSERTRVSSHIEDRVVGQEVEQPLISTGLHIGFGDPLVPLGGF